MALENLILEGLIPDNQIYAQIARFLTIFLVGVFLTRFALIPAVEALVGRNSESKKLKNQIHNIFLILGLFVSLILALQAGEFGSLVTVIGAIAAALTVAIGFGMREEVANVVSGIIIHLNTPFVRGDYVKVADEEGEVKDISISSTRLKGHSSDEISVPNSKVRAGSIRNYTRGRRTKSSIEMTLESEKAEESAELLKEKAQEQEEVLGSPPPEVLYRGFQEEKMDFEIHYWVKDSSDAKRIKSEVLSRFNSESKEKGLLKKEESDGEDSK